MTGSILKLRDLISALRSLDDDLTKAQAQKLSHSLSDIADELDVVLEGTDENVSEDNGEEGEPNV